MTEHTMTPERSVTTVVFYDVYGVKADARSVDALARLQLAARRCQCQVRLRGASKELRELVAFMGLREILPG
jgi:ABC-type transporter Mla MlaB component